MAGLKLTTNSIHQVDSFELDRFATDAYGVAYSTAIALGCENNTRWEVVPELNPVSDADRRRFSVWLESGRAECSPHPRIILIDLIERRMISDGVYLITVL